MECGSGMNLHLDNNNPMCKCKQDSVYVPPGFGDFRPSRGFPLRPKSSYNSPRPPSGSSANQVPSSSPVSNASLAITSTTISKEKVLLRYTDGGIKRPITPIGNQSSGALPRIVRRYIGRRSMQCHDLSQCQQIPTVYIDTSQLHNPLSIISPGVCNASR